MFNFFTQRQSQRSSVQTIRDQSNYKNTSILISCPPTSIVLYRIIYLWSTTNSLFNM